MRLVAFCPIDMMDDDRLRNAVHRQHWGEETARWKNGAVTRFLSETTPGATAAAETTGSSQGIHKKGNVVLVGPGAVSRGRGSSSKPDWHRHRYRTVGAGEVGARSGLAAIAESTRGSFNMFNCSNWLFTTGLFSVAYEVVLGTCPRSRRVESREMPYFFFRWPSGWSSCCACEDAGLNWWVDVVSKNVL